MRLRRVFLATWIAAFCFPALCCAAVADESVESLQHRFDAENNAEHKAHLLDKLCPAQIVAQRDASRTGDMKTAGLIMEKYRDNVRAALEALKKQHPNARKHSGGYKRIEVQAAKGLREVEDLALAMPDVYKPPMQIVHTDLAAMEDELLKLLFPDRPADKPLPKKNPSSDATPPPPSEKKP